MNKVLILGILFISLQACDNPVVLTPETAHKNIVTGMYWTAESGPEPMASWGNPQFPAAIKMPPESSENNSAEESPDLPEFLALHPPYPNPSDGNNFINVSIPRSSHVKLWIETAYFDHSGDIPFQRINQQFQKIPIYEGDAQVGYHSFYPGLKSRCIGGELNDGFYRIFLHVNEEHLLWQDIYVAGCKPLPNFFNTVKTQNWYY